MRLNMCSRTEKEMSIAEHFFPQPDRLHAEQLVTRDVTTDF
jgi:hypothetical protein